jgi:phosphoribosylformimino-5-aminoimidazole carboxamide ribonucleotide (ProFAR) isomerase
MPAIDVSDGLLAAYTPSGPRAVSAFGGDPVAAAASAVDAGATWLHVVDMDLAFAGEVANADVVASIRKARSQVRIQASGGITSWAEAARFLDAGADRVVLGSGALGDEDAVASILGRAEGHVVVGLETDGGRITSRGRSSVDLDLMSTVGWLVMLSVPVLLVTAVGRVGGLGGPDVDTVRRVARGGRPTLAAGGIRDLDDLRALHEVGAAGAVVGRAALEGGLDLEGALAWATS